MRSITQSKEYVECPPCTSVEKRQRRAHWCKPTNYTAGPHPAGQLNPPHARGSTVPLPKAAAIRQICPIDDRKCFSQDSMLEKAAIPSSDDLRHRHPPTSQLAWPKRPYSVP